MILETKVEKKEQGVLQVECKISADYIHKIMNEVLLEVQLKARLKGFRPGKAPIHMVKKLYDGDIKYQTLNKVLPEVYEKVVKDHEIKPVTMPEFSGYETMQEGQDLFLRFTVETMPSVERLSSYQGLEAKKIEFDYKIDEVLEKELKILQETYASYEEISDVAKEGDFIRATYQILDGDQEISKKTNFFMVKEKDPYYTLSKNFLGKALKESGKVEVEFPADYPDKTLAGTKKTVEFSLEEGKRVSYPELNDDFAKKLGFETLDEVKKIIEKSFVKKTNEEATLATADKIYEALAETSEFSISPSVIVEQSQADLSNKVNQLLMQGKSIEKHLEDEKLDQAGFIEKVKAESLINIKKYLVVDQIAKDQNIDVSEQEVYDMITELKDNEVANRSQVEDYYKKNQKAKDALKERIKFLKVASWMVENVKITGTEKKNLGE